MTIETLTIKKEVEVEVSIDYVRCSHCGKDLTVEICVDAWGDIEVNVDQHDCEE